MRTRLFPIALMLSLGVAACATDYTKSEAPNNLRVDGSETRIDLTEELREYFVGQIEYRRQNPGDDLISALVRAQEGDETLSDLDKKVERVLSVMTQLQGSMTSFASAVTPSSDPGSTPRNFL